MYIVIPIDKDGNYTAPARLMPVEMFNKVSEIMRRKPDLHVVDEKQIDSYPAEIFVDKEVKRYVKKIKNG
jgi:hypothetical protein